MRVEYCHNCDKWTGHKRNLSVGTLIMIVITFGFGILAIPFYPKRCIICGMARGQGKNADQVKPMAAIIIIIATVLFFIMVFSK